VLKEKRKMTGKPFTTGEAFWSGRPREEKKVEKKKAYWSNETEL